MVLRLVWRVYSGAHTHSHVDHTHWSNRNANPVWAQGCAVWLWAPTIYIACIRNQNQKCSIHRLNIVNCHFIRQCDIHRKLNWVWQISREVADDKFSMHHAHGPWLSADIGIRCGIVIETGGWSAEKQGNGTPKKPIITDIVFATTRTRGTFVLFLPELPLSLSVCACVCVFNPSTIFKWIF